MTIGALSLPFNDADLTGANAIVFTVGGVEYTATVALPVSGGGLSHGYYNYKTTGASRSDSLAQAVADALAAASSRTVSVSNPGSSGLPGRVRFVVGGSPATVVLKWTDGDTTFDGSWLGFDTTSDSSGLNSATSTWPAGRMFLPPRSTWTVALPQRTVTESITLGGKHRATEINPGYESYRLRFPGLAPARVFSWFAGQSEWVDGVYLMVDNDPNTPFQALWAWMVKRRPLRYWLDRDDDTTYLELSVPDLDGQLAELKRIGSDPHELRGSVKMLTIDFRALAYKG